MSNVKRNFFGNIDRPAAMLFYRVQRLLGEMAWRLVYDSRASLELRAKAKRVTENVSGWAQIVTGSIIANPRNENDIDDGTLEKMVLAKLETMRGPRTPAENSESESPVVVGRRK